MMAVLTLSLTFDMCASMSERSYNAQHIGTAPSTDNYDKPNKFHPSEVPDFLPDYDFIFDGLYCHIYENDKNKVEITYRYGDASLNKFYVAGDLIIPSSVKYEGKEYGTGEFADALCDDAEIRNKKIWDAFSHLSEVQKRRMMMLAAGLSMREIARREDKDIKTIRESIEAARKKFLKFY